MEVNTTFDFYGTYNVDNFRKIIEENVFDWSEWDFRTKKFPMLRQTQTIPLLFDETWNHKYVMKHKHYPLFETEILLLENHLKNNVFKSDGYILNALLVKLEANKTIAPHCDHGLHFHRSIFTRIHLPIFTNEDCIFQVGEDKKNLKVGEMWDPNYTQKIHSVVNFGKTDRIHLIFDWVKKTPTDVGVVS